MTTSYETIEGLQIKGDFQAPFAEILSEEAQRFLLALHQQFDGQRRALLKAREARQAEIDQGQLPDFLPETKHIREGDWKVAPLPPDLLNRRVEITGPVERKMIINALNSGAKCFMADFEDSNTPSWHNNLQGQVNLRDAIRREISFEDAKRGKRYTLNEQTAVMLVRPRGWHLEEKHLLAGGQPMSGSLVDFGLYFFHNAKTVIGVG